MKKAPVLLQRIKHLNNGEIFLQMPSWRVLFWIESFTIPVYLKLMGRATELKIFKTRRRINKNFLSVAMEFSLSLAMEFSLTLT
jgi:hypothetical protein